MVENRRKQGAFITGAIVYLIAVCGNDAQENEAVF